MPQDKSARAREARETNIDKKNIVLQTAKPRPKRWVGVVIALFVFLAGGAGYFHLQASGGRPNGTPTVENNFPSGSVNADKVILPAALFQDGRARHFEFDTGTEKIRYFVLKSSDGVIRAAFDACDVCWPAGLGYFQQEDRMVCRNCGRQFRSIRINEVRGGCNPAPLNRTVENGKVVIRTADILSGKPYFDFSGGA